MSLIDTSGCSGGRCSGLKRACQAHHCTFPASNNSVCALSPLLRPQPQSSAPPTSACFYGPQGTLYNYLSCPQLPYKLSRGFSLSPPQAGATGDTSGLRGAQRSLLLVPRFANCRVSAAAAVGPAGCSRGADERPGYGVHKRLRAGSWQPANTPFPSTTSTPLPAWNLSSLNPERARQGDCH